MIFPLPLIRREHYDTFRRDVGSDLADTYDEWIKFHAKDRNERIRRGESLVEIQVDPDEFSRFLATRGVKGSLKSLLDFTIEKHTGNHY